MMQLSKRIKRTENIALTAILLAVTIVLSWAETLLLPDLPTGIKLGLSNITIMTAVIFINAKAGITLTILKSVFVLLTRGVIAGMMSLSGGVLALIVIILLLKKTDCSYIFVSVLAAVCHIIGQIAFSMIMTESFYVISYAPILLLTSTMSGILTGVLLKALASAMIKIKNQSKI
jgi:heptaprenyl diphosphate synthase